LEQGQELGFRRARLEGQQVDTRYLMGTKLMGKRKAKRKNGKPHRPPAVEVLEAGPLRFERQGRFIRMQNRLPPDKLNEVHEALARERDAIPAQIHALANEISDLIQPFNSFDVLAWFGFFHMAQDPETYRESSHKGVAADVEYLNMMVLRGPYREGTIEYPEPPRVTTIQEGSRRSERWPCSFMPRWTWGVRLRTWTRSVKSFT